MREFLNQYFTGKQNGCLQSGRLQEVVAYKKWSQGESWLYLIYVFLVLFFHH